MLGGQDQCCIKGCSEKASFRKITSLAGVLELEIEPDLISQVNELNIRICNYHYYFDKQRGHKQKQFYHSVVYSSRKHFEASDKSDSKNLSALCGVKTCSSCNRL